MSYDKVDDLARRLGSAILELDAVPEMEFPDEQYEGARKMRQLGIFSKNRVEWFVTEQAANAYGVTIIPLYDTLGDDAVRYVLNQTSR